MTNGNMHYSDYLALDSLLNLQNLASDQTERPAHDEMLFIIIHQVYELWFKQILFELQSINQIFEKEVLDDKKLGLISARMERNNKIMKILVDQVSIIETMTALDFLEFRDLLSPASGFQSLQFRLLETILGIKDRSAIEKNFFELRLNKKENKILETALNQNSLLVNMNSWLERMPFTQSENFNFWQEYKKSVDQSFAKDIEIIKNNSTLDKDRQTEEIKRVNHSKEQFLSLFKEKNISKFSNAAIINALFIFLYQDYPILHLPFKILNQMIDFDQLLTKWRQAHAIMAKRMLGSKIGTGGSAGHKYLKKTADKHSVFADLFLVSSYLIPKFQRPKLPQELENNLSYHYNVSRTL